MANKDEMTGSSSEFTRINISVAEIKKDIGYIRAGFDEMKSDVRNLKEGFITRGEYIEFKASEYAEFKKQVAEALAEKAENKVLDVYIKALWIIAGTVLTALANSVFQVIRIN